MCPQVCDEGDLSISINYEPERVPYDPICGFDRLITLKNDPNFDSVKDNNSFMSTKNKYYAKGNNSKNLLKNNSVGRLVPLDWQNVTQPNE